MNINGKKQKKSSGLKENKLNIENLCEEYRTYLDNVLNTKISLRFLDACEEVKRQRLKSELKSALRECGTGSKGAAVYVKEHIKEWLINEKRADMNFLNEVAGFNRLKLMEGIKKFDILLYLNQDKKQGAFDYIYSKLNKMYPRFEELTEDMVDKVFADTNTALTFSDKLELAAQWIYEEFCGIGCIDMLFYEEIDGISCGVSGIGTVVWIFYKGRHIKFEFIKLKSEAELERICRKIYKYGATGELSANKGYIISSMRDGSRVVVLRPPFAKKWSFFIRKFLKEELISLEKLYEGIDVTFAETLLRCIIASEQVIAITGEQGAGKTTLLKTLVSYIPKNYTIRTQESDFELNLDRLYPDRNITEVCETVNIDGREGIDVQKKTDGLVMIIGEVVNAKVAGHMLLAAQTTGRFTMFTHHARSAKALVNTLRNDLMETGAFSNEELAKRQVCEVVRFDIHLVKDKDGKRYIERITEIVPETDEYRNIIEFNNGSYKVSGKISKSTMEEIKRNISKEYIPMLKAYAEGGEEI